MRKSEMLFFEKYKQTKDVTLDECYMGGKNCGTCMHCVEWAREYDCKWNWFENRYCTCALLCKEQ